MKNSPVSILACACLVLSAFLGGLFVGRNIRGDSIEISALSSKPTTLETAVPSTATPSASIPATTTAPNNGKININTADLYTLMTLEGIGETYAQRIIDYRNANGPFKDITELKNVVGIGEKRFDAIKYDITTGG